jgi:NAD(P)-dependent dehydrogenase (short-subunit alcohol dehydrogenase family)
LSLAGRIILITGASRGLGAAVARTCAAEGAQLVLVARTRGALEELDDEVQRRGAPPATLVALDLTKGELVDRLGAALFERWGRLDGLVHGAAELDQLTPVAHLEPRAFERAMAGGPLALHRLIRTLDPLLRRSDAGRAVIVTDRPARQPVAYWGAYAAAKAAIEALTLAWAAELAITPVRVNLFAPGPMATRLRARAFPGEPAGAAPPPDAAAAALAQLLDPGCVRHGERIDQAG